MTVLALAGTATAQTTPHRPGPINPPPLPAESRTERSGPEPAVSAGFAAPNNSTWTALGPAPLNSGGSVSGRIAGVAVDPTNVNNIYIAAAGGGVWQSTDGGATYLPLTDTQGTLAMGAIAIAPSNHLKLYAGTGEANNSADSNFGLGILISNDGGATWSLSTGPGGAFNRLAVGKIAVHPSDQNTAYAAVNDFAENGFCCSNTGVYKTSDGGVTWTNVTSAAGKDSLYPWTDVAVDPNSPTILYAAHGDIFNSNSTNGVYRSLDSGATWSLLTNAPNGGGSVGRIALAVAPSASNANQHVLYVAVSTAVTVGSGGLYQMLRSDNADSATPTFTNLTSTPNFGGSQGWYDWVIAVDPANSANVYAAGVTPDNVIQSTNSGASWTNISSAGGVQPHTDSHALVFDSAGRLLLGSDGGVWRFNPSTPGWTNLNGNLNTIQFTGIGLHPTSTQTVIGGSQDNGTELTTGSLMWNEVEGGDGGYSEISQTSPNICYANHPIGSFGPSSFFQVSTDGCNTWGARTPVVGNTNLFNFYSPVFVDPSNGNRDFLGGDELYESTNASINWTGHTNPDTAPIDTIAALSGNNTIYIATGGTFATSSHVWVSTTDGTSWTQHDLPVGGRVQEIDIDPNDTTGATAVAVINTFNGASGQVYRTINGGTNWTNITASLPAIPTWSAKIDTDASHTMYVSNETGVYSAPGPYSTWTAVGSGLPHAQGVQLALNSSLHVLALATHGRGAWYFSTLAAQQTQTINFPALSNKPIGTPPFAITATASSGLPVSFTSTTTPVCTISGSTVTLVKGGTCSITAAQAGDASYLPATSITQSFHVTVGTTPQTITFAPLPNQPIGTPPFAVTATASSGLAVIFSSHTPAICTLSGNTVTLVATGTCTVIASQPGSAVYAPATAVAQSFQVTKLTQTITFAPLANRPLNTAPFAVSATASSGLPVSFASTTTSICGVSANTVTLVAIGKCIIKATQAGNGTYLAATPVGQGFQVTKIAQTITFAPLTNQPFNTPPFAVTATASSGLPVSFVSTTTSICTVSGSTVTLLAVGRCNITATQSGNGTYLAATPVTQGFQVTKAPQTITFAPLPGQTLGNPPFNLTATASSGLTVSFGSATPTTCTVSGNTVTLVATGHCGITATQAGNATYSAAAPVTQVFQIQP